MPDYGYIAENVARTLGAMMFGLGSYSLFNPVEGARTFGGESTIKDEKDALMFPIVGGRNMAMGATLLALSFTGQRKGVATAMAAMCLAGAVDVWWCLKHGSEKWTGHLIDKYADIPYIQSLTIDIDSDNWATVEERGPDFAWQRRYTQEELKMGKGYEDLSKLRDLKAFHVVSNPRYLDVEGMTRRQQRKWRQNCGAYKALLRSIVTQPKDAAPLLPRNEEGDMRLYAGSAVCFGTIKLRKITAGCKMDYGLERLYEAVGDEAFEDEVAA